MTSRADLLGTAATFSPPNDAGAAASEAPKLAPAQSPQSCPEEIERPLTGASQRGRPQAPRAPPELDAYSIREFCRRHSLTPYLFYKLQRQGLAPKVMQLGGRKLVSAEAAARWRKARERTATPRPRRGTTSSPS
jgi:hypothetical protein